MKRSLKIFLIYFFWSIGLLAYLNMGWAYGYYFSNPDLVTSDWLRMFLDPWGSSKTVEYGGAEQSFWVFFGVPYWVLSGLAWIAVFVFLLFFQGGLAKLFI